MGFSVKWGLNWMIMNGIELSKLGKIFDDGVWLIFGAGSIRRCIALDSPSCSSFLWFIMGCNPCRWRHLDLHVSSQIHVACICKLPCFGFVLNFRICPKFDDFTSYLDAIL